MICTWTLCLFNFPAYMDCNVGYLIPSSHPLLGQDDGRHCLPVHLSSVQGEDCPLQEIWGYVR